jgi:hypothetical protein
MGLNFKRLILSLDVIMPLWRIRFPAVSEILLLINIFLLTLNSLQIMLDIDKNIAYIYFVIQSTF